MFDSIRKRDLKPKNDAYEDGVVATPEGDNEYAPDEPVGPVDGLQVAGGNAPLTYDADKTNHSPANPQDANHPAGSDAVANDHPDHNAHSHSHGHEVVDEVEETVDKLSLGQIMT